MSFGTDGSMEFKRSKFLEIRLVFLISRARGFNDLDLAAQCHIHLIALNPGCVCECADCQRFFAH